VRLKLRIEQDYSMDIREVRREVVPYFKDSVDAHHVLKLKGFGTVQFTYLTLKSPLLSGLAIF
jgi:hypothetical protein